MPEGNLEEIGGLKAYVTGPPDSKRAILFLSDAYGFEGSNLSCGYPMEEPSIVYGGKPSRNDFKCDRPFGFSFSFSLLYKKLAEKVADAGFLVVVPDFLYGDPYNPSHIDRDAWLKARDPGKGCEDAKTVIDALKTKGVSAIGAAGFCWGGMALVKLAKYGYSQAAVVLHPGVLTIEDINEVKIPTALLGAEFDHIFSAELLTHLGNVLAAKPEVESFLKIYPGVNMDGH